jgi:hypothetical protein
MPQNSDTPVTFSREETGEISRQLSTADEVPVCPVCGNELTVRGPIAGEYCYIKCHPCGRSALVTVSGGGAEPDA